MKVCYFLGSLNRGGSEMLALDISRNIRKVENIEFFLLHRKLGNLHQEFNESQVPKQQIYPKGFFDFFYFLRLRRYFKKNSIEVVHTHQPIDAFFTLIACYKLNIKIICTHHGFLPSRINKFLLFFILNRTDKNVFVSNSCLNIYKEYLNKDHISNSVVLYNGIDTKKLNKRGKDIRKELNIDQSCFLMGMVGNFYINSRDQLTICKALPSVFDILKNAHFVFIGGKSQKNPEYFDNCYRYCVERGIQNRVHFLGLREDIPEILNNLDLFVYASNYETFGIAVVEAMMSGLPCIINDIDALVEISLNGKYCCVFKSANENDLLSKISSLANDKFRLKYGNEAAAFALEKYAIESHIRSLNDLYENIINA